MEWVEREARLAMDMMEALIAEKISKILKATT